MSVETFVPSNTVVSLTDAAKKHFSAKLAKADKNWIRLSTRVSGCTGYAYVLDFADSPEADDETLDAGDNVQVAIASNAVSLLRGTEIDYVMEGVNGVIKYYNPNVVDECGCGESFNIG